MGSEERQPSMVAAVISPNILPCVAGHRETFFEALSASSGADCICRSGNWLLEGTWACVKNAFGVLEALEALSNVHGTKQITELLMGDAIQSNCDNQQNELTLFAPHLGDADGTGVREVPSSSSSGTTIMIHNNEIDPVMSSSPTTILISNNETDAAMSDLDLTTYSITNSARDKFEESLQDHPPAIIAQLRDVVTQSLASGGQFRPESLVRPIRDIRRKGIPKRLRDQLTGGGDEGSEESGNETDKRRRRPVRSTNNRYSQETLELALQAPTVCPSGRLLCNICPNFSTDQIADLRKHYFSTHLLKQTVSCGLCPRSFTSKSYLRRHIAVVHPGSTEESLTCTCGIAFSSRIELYKHKPLCMVKGTHPPAVTIAREEGSDGDCELDVMSVDQDLRRAGTAPNLGLTPHTVGAGTGGKQPILRCGLCFFRSFWPDEVDEHTRRYHVDTDHYCAECTQVFKTPRALRRHQVTHGVKWTCDVCGQSYSNRRYFSDHVKSHNNNYVKPTYGCDQCDKSFTTPYILRGHVDRVHLNNPSPFQCEVCNRPFSQRNHLAEHMNTHTGLRPYECDVCNKSYAHKGTLLQHMLTHNEEKTYHCEICGKAFKCRSTLALHRTTLHTDRRHQCHICGKTFTQKQAQQRHERTHTGERPFSCAVCQKAFNDSSVLRRHEAVHRRESENSAREQLLLQSTVSGGDEVADEQATTFELQPTEVLRSSRHTRGPRKRKQVSVTTSEPAAVNEPQVVEIPAPPQGLRIMDLRPGSAMNGPHYAVQLADSQQMHYEQHDDAQHMTVLHQVNEPRQKSLPTINVNFNGQCGTNASQVVDNLLASIQQTPQGGVNQQAELQDMQTFQINSGSFEGQVLYPMQLIQLDGNPANLGVVVSRVEDVNTQAVLNYQGGFTQLLQDSEGNIVYQTQ